MKYVCSCRRRSTCSGTARARRSAFLWSWTSSCPTALDSAAAGQHCFFTGWSSTKYRLLRLGHGQCSLSSASSCKVEVSAAGGAYGGYRSKPCVRLMSLCRRLSEAFVTQTLRRCGQTRVHLCSSHLLSQPGKLRVSLQLGCSRQFALTSLVAITPTATRRRRCGPLTLHSLSRPFMHVGGACATLH